MTAPVLVPTAALAPGACFLSGDHNGPFIDTQKSIRGTGRVYLSLKALGPLVRECGWVPVVEVEEQLETVAEASEAHAAREWAHDRYVQIVEALTPLLPQPVPEVHERAVFKDDRVRQENEQLKAEIDSLRLELHEATVASQAAPLAVDPAAADPAPESEGSAPVDAGSASTIEVNGGSVDLDELLKENVQTILSVVEGWDETALFEIAAAETERPQPRKTILALAE